MELILPRGNGTEIGQQVVPSVPFPVGKFHYRAHGGSVPEAKKDKCLSPMTWANETKITLTDCLDICTSACLRSGRSSRRG